MAFAVRLAGLLTLMLSACAPSNQGAEEPQPTPSVAAPSRSLTSVTTLAGEWCVAGIDGQPLDEPVGIALSGDAGQLWWEPRCAGLVRRYRISGQGIAFGPAGDAVKVAPGGSPPPVCAIALPPRLSDVARALDRARTVGRTAANGILIEGAGHSVLLFSQ